MRKGLAPRARASVQGGTGHNAPDRGSVSARSRSPTRLNASTVRNIVPAGRNAIAGAVLAVEQLSVDLPTPRGRLRAVDRVDLGLAAGHTLGIVGESGSGKTILSRARGRPPPQRYP
jgi:ABC-type uncharacterized transport system fused permease/ATPase subunit